jgi:signal transduction histidine kinase/DNA-binding response OmpR family regulator
MFLGIQGRVALLVILATAASALLVARMLTARATEVLREHEVVDLGDEAMLRGWEIVDRIDGLRDDLFSLAFSGELQAAVVEGVPPDELGVLVRALCRRSWNEHLRIDLVSLDHPSEPAAVIREKALVDEADLWMPDGDILSGGGIWFSPIQRLRLVREDLPGEPLRRSEAVIWGIAPIGAYLGERDGPELFIRLATTLYMPDSPRHLFAFTDGEGSPIVRPDEASPQGGGNDEVFLALGRDPRLLAALAQRRAAADDPERTREEPKIERIIRSDFVPLAEPFYFQEGKPGKGFAAALGEMDEDELEAFLEDIQARLGRSVRIGGMLSGVREVRLLAHNRNELAEVREQLVAELAERFGEAFDGIDWRNTVECDEIHSWAVRLLVGEGENQSEYLLHYAVLDDELASSIEYEMLSLQSISLLVAGGFGLIGFFFAMRFIRPLKEMTLTAQRITESPREGLLRELSALAKRLDLRRRDEVGEIARASKRLFEELIAFQAELEERVHDRTRELRRANLDLEKANEKLKSLSYEKDAFVAKVSHDLRQPLNAIFLQVEALGLSPLDDSQRKDVQRIRDHAARELKLVNDILEYQKIIMGAETLERDTIRIAPLLEDLAATHRASLGDRPVGLAAEYPAGIGELVADDRRLRQVLGNLLGNACKFTREGSVAIAARPQQIDGEDWVEFTVADSGRGMAPAEQAKAFVPFVSNKKDNAGGTGLGLSICRELVSQMGGRIGFVSELGKGTQFSVFLPRVAAAERYDPSDALPTAPAARPEAEGGEPIAPCGTVLVIDDDARVRDLIRRVLEQEGHRVLAAADGQEGIEIAERQRPDAITLDVVMPGGLDGWEVLRRLKESPSTQSIPVIMVSVMAEAGGGLALEVEDYLTKPIDVDRLVRSVHRATRSVPQRNLLLVDDDEGSLEAMARLLEAAGWSTLSARDGAEALGILERTLPAAIVLDLLMPEMDGFEFLRRLRGDPRWRAVPVIVMTGKDPSEAERAFLRSRVEAVLSKGSDGASELVDAVKARLRRGAG